ncbi:MAG: carboxypeptidase-like regulatory domain-containing protein, partial [bacterium]
MQRKNPKIVMSFALIVLMLFTVNLLKAQMGSITGRVTEEGSKSPLPYANVQIVGTNMGAATNMKGDFVIQRVPAGTYTIKASYVGYQDVTTEVKVV